MSAADIVQSDYAAWRHPSQNCEIYIDSLALRSLSVRTLRFSRKEKAVEIGGVFWGKIMTEDGARSIVIRQVEFIPAENRLFNTTPGDFSRLEAALGRPRLDLQPVGYFRSDLAGKGELRDEDRSFIKQKMVNPDSVFLIVKPMDELNCIAAFYYWEKGQLKKDTSMLEFAGREYTPCRREPPTQVEPSTAIVELPQSLQHTRQSTERGLARSRPSTEVSGASHEVVSAPWPFLKIIGSIAVFTLLAALSSYFGVWPRPKDVPPPANPDIDLQVSRKLDGQLDLTWNSNLPGLANAVGAILSITDGPSRRSLDLTKEQLVSGKLVYFARNDDVDFDLKVLLDDKRSITRSIRVVSDSPREPDAAIEHQDASRAKSPVSAPFFPNGAPGVTSPQPVHQVMPNTNSPGLFLDKNREIDVQVNVDQNGAVTKASLPKADDSPLATEAVVAARQWKFKPAERAGRPIAADYVIRFLFQSPSEAGAQKR